MISSHVRAVVRISSLKNQSSRRTRNPRLTSSSSLRRRILEALRANGKTVVVITHDKALARRAERQVELVGDFMPQDVVARVQRVIGDRGPGDPKEITRVVFCSGKVYYELLKQRREQGIDDIALTTNASLLSRHVEALRAAGLGRRLAGDLLEGGADVRRGAEALPGVGDLHEPLSGGSRVEFPARALGDRLPGMRDPGLVARLQEVGLMG